MGIHDRALGGGTRSHSAPRGSICFQDGQRTAPRGRAVFTDVADPEAGAISRAAQRRGSPARPFGEHFDPILGPASLARRLGERQERSAAPEAAKLSGGLSTTLERSCPMDRLELYFASNLQDTSKGCHRDDSSGCGIWYADIDLPSPTLSLGCAPRVRSLSPVFAPSDGWGRWFPSVEQESGGRRILSYNKTRPKSGAGGLSDSMYNRNRVVIAPLSGASSIGSVRSIKGARFPDLAQGARHIAYTQYDAFGGSNTRISAVNGSVLTLALPTVVSRTAQLYTGTAQDPSFVFTPSGTDACLVYHRPSEEVNPGEMQGMLACSRGRSPYWPSIANNTDGKCGHFAATADGNWVSCSGDSKLRYYGTPVGFGRGRKVGGPRWFNRDPGDAGVLVDWRAEDYSKVVASWPKGTCNRFLFQVYSEWGNTSSVFVYTALCRDSDDKDVTRSARLFLGRKSFSAGVSRDPLNMSELLGDYYKRHLDARISLRDADYCSADFVYHSVVGSPLP